LCNTQPELAGLAAPFEVAHDVHNVGKPNWTRLRRHGNQQQQAGDDARVAKNATLHVVRQLPPQVWDCLRVALGFFPYFFDTKNSACHRYKLAQPKRAFFTCKKNRLNVEVIPISGMSYWRKNRNRRRVLRDEIPSRVNHPPASL
jgi:hypothetical protein